MAPVVDGPMTMVISSSSVNHRIACRRVQDVLLGHTVPVRGGAYDRLVLLVFQVSLPRPGMQVTLSAERRRLESGHDGSSASGGSDESFGLEELHRSLGRRGADLVAGSEVLDRRDLVAGL